MGLIVNDNNIIDSSGLNAGTTIMFEDGREVKLYTNDEVNELINILTQILENGNLL